MSDCSEEINMTINELVDVANELALKYPRQSRTMVIPISPEMLNSLFPKVKDIVFTYKSEVICSM
tara:strand:- start:166 stop:360 length:195 start_codon:yes stop_codon:yes gene_type:complete